MSGWGAGPKHACKAFTYKSAEFIRRAPNEKNNEKMYQLTGVSNQHEVRASGLFRNELASEAQT